MTINLHELINTIILHELTNGIILHEIIGIISALTEVENGQIAADDAAADRLALALAGAAGAVAERGGGGVRDEEELGGVGGGWDLLLPSLRRRRTRPLVATPWRRVTWLLVH